MSRARKRPIRRVPARRKAARKPRPPVVRRTIATPSQAEARLLALAREMEGWGADALPRAIRALAAAYAPDAELPKLVQRAWLHSRDDKTAALALAWAREQLRLALEAVLAATPPSARGTLALPVDTLAWLLLAACESLAYEPPAAAADRLRLLLELTGRGALPE